MRPGRLCELCREGAQHAALLQRPGTLVKENEHQRLTAEEGVSSRLRAANSITALIWPRSSPSNQFIMSSVLAPACKFSKMTETGMRVPRRTQAPLTFPGMLSTAGTVTNPALA